MLATVFTRYRARCGDPGAVSEWEGTDLFGLLKHEGAWRIVSLAFASETEWMVRPMAIDRKSPPSV